MNQKRIETPVRIQMEAAECASTALNIILSYYEKYVPTADLRYWCGVSRDGSDAYNLVEAAKHFGLEAVGYQATFEELKEEVDAPAVLFWDLNHFVVYEGHDDVFVYINDPSTGPRRLIHSEFLRHYSQVAIAMVPSGSFRKEGEKPAFLSALWKRIEGYRLPILGITTLQVIMTITGVIIAILSQVFIDDYIIRGDKEGRLGYIAFFLLILVMNTGAIFLQGYFFARMRIKLAVALSSSYFWHLLRLPIRFFLQRFGGEVVSRVTINNRVSAIVTGEFGMMILNTVLIVLYLVVIWQYDAMMAILALILSGGLLGLITYLNRIRMNLYARAEQDRAVMTGKTIDTLSNMESTALSGSEQFSFQKIQGLFSMLTNRRQHLGKIDAVILTLSQFSTQTASFLILALGGWRIMFGSLTIGMLVTLNLLINRLFKPIQHFGTVAMMVPTLKMDLQRLDDVLHEEEDEILFREETNPSLEEEAEGTLRFDRVTFGYLPLDDPLFEELDFSVDAGEFVGISGENGSGKSTLAKIAVGQCIPWSGKVVIGGYPLMDPPSDLVRKTIIHLQENNLFFEGTVRDNLTLWNPHIHDGEIIKVLKEACIHDVVMDLNDGLQYSLREDAEDFSQGQKQRLAIARALLHRPKILILDETLNGLDADNQQTILDNLRKRKLTVIMITHNQTLLEQADRILTLKEGQWQ